MPLLSISRHRAGVHRWLQRGEEAATREPDGYVPDASLYFV
jgi:hypothetical protein